MRTQPAWLPQPGSVSVAEQPARRRCAVIYNPTRVSDEFRTNTAGRLDPTAWDRPMWLETTAEDPGHSMAASAVEAGVDLVIAAGGDGTVRIAAVDVALQMHTRAIDMIKLTVDDQPSEHFAVMAGTGTDAMIMDETNEDLKKVIGPGAYFLAAAKALGRLPIDMTI